MQSEKLVLNLIKSLDNSGYKFTNNDVNPFDVTKWPEYNNQVIYGLDVNHEFINYVGILNGERLIVLCDPEYYLQNRIQVAHMKRTVESYHKTEVLISFEQAPCRTDFYVYEFLISDDLDKTIEELFKLFG